MFSNVSMLTGLLTWEGACFHTNLFLQIAFNAKQYPIEIHRKQQLN